MDTDRRTISRGFTTIEILIVIVILAIVTAVAVPMVSNRADFKVAAATRALVADLQYAQNFAIATRQGVYVRFDENTYTLCSKDGGSLVALTHPVDKGSFLVRLGSAPTASALAGVKLAKPDFSGNAVLGFDPVGVPFSYNESTAARSAMSAAATVSLSCGDAAQTVRIEPYTGEISAQ